MVQDDSQDNPDQPQSSDVDSITLRTRWPDEDDVPLLFINQFFIRLQNDAFLLSFGEVELPRELELSDETRQKLDSEGLPVRVRTRIAISPGMIPNFIEQLTRINNVWLEQSRGHGEFDATE